MQGLACAGIIDRKECGMHRARTRLSKKALAALAGGAAASLAVAGIALAVMLQGGEIAGDVENLGPKPLPPNVVAWSSPGGNWQEGDGEPGFGDTEEDLACEASVSPEGVLTFNISGYQGELCHILASIQNVGTTAVHIDYLALNYSLPFTLNGDVPAVSEGCTDFCRYVVDVTIPAGGSYGIGIGVPILVEFTEPIVGHLEGTVL